MTNLFDFSYNWNVDAAEHNDFLPELLLTWPLLRTKINMKCSAEKLFSLEQTVDHEAKVTSCYHQTTVFEMASFIHYFALKRASYCFCCCVYTRDVSFAFSVFILTNSLTCFYLMAIYLFVPKKISGKFRLP